MKSINRSLPRPFCSVNSGGIENFSGRKDYLLNIKEGRLYHKKPYYFFELREGGYIPKSGIHLADYFINQYDKTKIKHVLEIGVGELAFLPITLVKNNIAEKVDGVEVDPIALDWSKRNIYSNDVVKKISLYDGLGAVSANQYDLIFSNPPQMPVIQNKSLHDDGGIDGYQVIDQVVNYSHTNLRNQGRLVMLVFDFLNIIKIYNNSRPALADTLQQCGYAVNIRQSIFRPIRPGGRTEQSLDCIKKQYPGYEFKHKDKMGYNLLILEAIKK